MTDLEQVLDRLDRLSRLAERGIVAIEALVSHAAEATAEAKKDEQLWTVREVASFLRCSSSKVYRSAEVGHLPKLVIGGQLRFEPEAVRSYARGTPAPRAHVVVRFPART